MTSCLPTAICSTCWKIHAQTVKANASREPQEVEEDTEVRKAAIGLAVTEDHEKHLHVVKRRRKMWKFCTLYLGAYLAQGAGGGGVRLPASPEMTCGVLIQLAFCDKTTFS